MRYFLAILSSASWLFLFLSPSSDGFSFVLMARRGQGNLQRSLEDSDAAAGNNKQGVASLNKGKGQEITGVTLPAEVRTCARMIV